MSSPAPVSILYHADCLDGFGAAYAAWRRFGEQATYRPLHHGEAWAEADIAGHEVFILDFSFSPAKLESMAGLARRIVQIDHHVSALRPWADRLLLQADGTLQFRHPTLPLQVIFMLEKSGTRLAWEHFQPDSPLPLALAHIEDIDLWRFALPGTREFCRALRLQPFAFEAWDELIDNAATPDAAAYRRLIDDGRAIERFYQNEVERLTQGHLPMPARLRGEPVDALQARRHGQPTITDGETTWQAITGIALNASALFSSELGHRLAQHSSTFGLTWQLAADGEVKASLRSAGEFDVSIIAARYGGGGHRNAAGFRLPLARFVAEVLGLA